MSEAIAWPNGLGYDVGPHEVWHWRAGETLVKLYGPHVPGLEEGDAFGVKLEGRPDPIDAVIEALRRYARTDRAAAAAGPLHTRDEDCTVDPATETCTVCGVSHCAICPHCKGRGFHKPDCSSPEMQAERAHDARRGAP